MKHDAQLTPEIGHRDRADVPSIQKDAPLLGFIQAAEQADDRAFARPRGAHQGDMFSGGDAEGEVAEDRIVRPIGEAHVLEDHLAATATHVGENPFGLSDLEGLLHQLADAFDRREPTLDLGETLRQLTQRIKQALGGQDEGGEGAKTHGAIGHHQAAKGQNQGNGGQSHPFQEG